MENPSILNFNAGSIRIIPFGGCGEFGMNMTAYIVEDRIYLVDCGVSFPDPAKLGIEALYPDMDPWLKQFGGVYSYVITHGHEDHIGALPYMLQKWPGPIYTTPWTAALIRNKLERRGLQLKYPIYEVNAGDRVDAEDFSIEFVHVNHSIPQACGLHIKSKDLSVFHTGDFKFDYSPVIEPVANIKRLEEIGRGGVDLLLADSTNAHIPGPSPSESAVVGPMRKAFDSSSGAILVTTFASNFWRIKTILDVCAEAGKKAVILGAGVENCLKIASDLGIYSAPVGLIIDASAVSSFDRTKIVVILTGSQGEWRSALMRLAMGEHKAFSIMADDTVIFSSRTIPGNERVIQTMMSLLERRGARIYSVRHDPLIHVSGHGYRDDLKTMIKSLNPKNFIPVHGTFSHLQSNSKIPQEIGLTTTKTFVVENGDVIDLQRSGVQLSDRLDISQVFIDSESYHPLEYDIMRERLRIGELGLVVVSFAYDPGEREILGRIQVAIQGLGLPQGDEYSDIEQSCAKAASKGFNRAFGAGDSKHDDICEHVRVEVRRVLFAIYKKKPVVLVHIHNI